MAGFGLGHHLVDLQGIIAAFLAQEIPYGGGGIPETLSSLSVTTSAPALMKGLRGIPSSCSSWMRELNGLPDGSRKIRFQILSPSSASTSASAKTLEMLWMEKARSESPGAKTSPFPGGYRNSKVVRVDGAELDDVPGHFVLAKVGLTEPGRDPSAVPGTRKGVIANGARS